MRPYSIFLITFACIAGLFLVFSISPKNRPEHVDGSMFSLPFKAAAAQDPSSAEPQEKRETSTQATSSKSKSPESAYYQLVPGNTFPGTDYNKGKNKSGKAFHSEFKPSFDCPKLTKVGNKKGDGGKWACGLTTLGNRTELDNYPCVVYSFGVNTESSFEAEVLQTTHCKIFAYDPKVNKMASAIANENPRIHFTKWGISGTNDDKKGYYTLKTLMEKNGNSWIDIFKIDVESWEFPSMKTIFQDFQELPFGQLLIEVHLYKWDDKDRKQVTDMFRELEKRGMRMFSIEPNEKAPKCCSEFSFINTNYLKLFID